MNNHETAYSTDQFSYYQKGCPEESAYEYFQENDCSQGDIIQVYEGEIYTPTNEDEVNGMIGEDWTFLVKNIKPSVIFGYDKKNNDVYEIDISEVK